MSIAQHHLHVRLLYKCILRLHRGLPPELRLVGDTYVRDEFKRHRHANAHETAVFMVEWTKYLKQLSSQLSPKGITKGELGAPLAANHLDLFSDAQLRQLYELKEEASRSATAQLDDNAVNSMLRS